MPVSEVATAEIPLEEFIDSLRTALGVNVPPDLAALFEQLRHASGPQIPYLLAQIALFVPAPDGYDDAPEFKDYERF